jgi:hypothetical protein
MQIILKVPARLGEKLQQLGDHLLETLDRALQELSPTGIIPYIFNASPYERPSRLQKICHTFQTRGSWTRSLPTLRTLGTLSQSSRL